jgi:hypothetical protein
MDASAFMDSSNCRGGPGEGGRSPDRTCFFIPSTIVGAVLSQHPVDRTLLHPVLDTCRQQLAEAGIGPKLRTVLAGSGYVSEDNFARADAGGLRLLAPLAKDPGRRRHRTLGWRPDRWCRSSGAGLPRLDYEASGPVAPPPPWGRVG